MITRNMKPYTLQILEIIRDEYGHTQEDWVDVGTMNVAINQSYYNSASNDGTLYRKKVVNGVTRQELLANDRKYRIHALNECYEIENFIPGRFIQLQLKEVVGFIKEVKFDGSVVMDGSITLDGDNKASPVREV